ncbi:MAG: choice-of-anchor A family protein [Hamadaea sp.]|uniref:choice-of-anchor A family protein n=1 Tax=Hamadaea sp. TaxID=2024425 RepID=UPI0017EB5022|nr:choice-of-anchor A family protein [Hamadaea sp.]NUR71533.1 choice-of-anchor A family protein [Hamadaea sp.]NUT19667.1 choice-of-anchor A family protein [Hamadaea sp.]
MRARSWLVTAATVGLTLGLTATGSQAAVVIDPLVGSEGFLVLVEQDAQLWAHEIEGTVAIGGDLRVGGNFTTLTQSTDPFTAPGDSAPTALIVNGRVDLANSTPGASLHVTGGGFMKIGDLSGVFVRDTDNNNASALTRIVPINDYNATPNVEVAVHEPASSVGPTIPLDVAGLFPTYRSISTQLATACPENVVPKDDRMMPIVSPYPPNTHAFITLTPGMTNVWNISAADLTNLAEITFTNQPTASMPLIVNVDTTGVGGDFTWDSPNLAGVGGAQAPYILWNFPDATRIEDVGGDSLEGTLYAPRADFVDLNPTNIEGAVVVKSMIMGSGRVDGGEVHLFPFAGNISCAEISPSPSPSPSSAMPAPSASTPTTPAPSPSGPILPDTGQPIVYIGVTSFGLLLGGAALLLVGRRRRDLSR